MEDAKYRRMIPRQYREERVNGLYWTCPECGANLDHGEKCDCQRRQKRMEDVYD